MYFILMTGAAAAQEYVRNPRGVQLFTCGWLPASSSPPKALVFLCHGT